MRLDTFKRTPITFSYYITIFDFRFKDFPKVHAKFAVMFCHPNVIMVNRAGIFFYLYFTNKVK